jgi:hypothetical protein
VRNPNSVAVVCAECSATTRLNVLTGRIYSHPLPSRTEACANSGRQIRFPTNGERFEVERLRYEARPSVYRAAESADSSSIRTISGGLPGTGRRA